MAFIRLVFFGFIGLSVLYFAVTWFARSTRRERLEKKWDAEHPEGDLAVRAEVVERGVDMFKASLVYRAFWLIYIVPAGMLLANLIFTNWN